MHSSGGLYTDVGAFSGKTGKQPKLTSNAFPIPVNAQENACLRYMNYRLQIVCTILTQ